MRTAPEFWAYGKKSPWPFLLSPLGAVYNIATSRRAVKTPRYKAPIPVICIGNLIMGGAGKTPTAMAVARYLKSLGMNPYFLSRGFGGHMKGPLIVGPHGTHEVGDEPLLLKQIAPVCVSADRVAGAKLCVKKGADVIIMDDGFQNPHLHKDLSLVVVDGGYGHGNGKVFPAGPLRETLKSGLKRADAVVLIGEDKTGAVARMKQVVSDLPILRAYIKPEERDGIEGRRLVAFAGIGRPEKFFETLAEMGGDVVEAVSFPDHHPFVKDDIKVLKDKAKDRQAILMTTEKDFMRLPKEFSQGVDIIKISLVWEGEDVLKPVFAKVTG